MSRRVRTLIGLLAISLLSTGRSFADDLSGKIETLFGDVGIEGINIASNVNHDAHFGSESFRAFSLLVQNLSAQAADVPAVSTVPGLTYRFDPNLQVFEPASGNLGPVFVERGTTLGAGKFDIGFYYVFVDFSELDGEDLDSLELRGLSHNDCCPGPGGAPPPGQSPNAPPFEADDADVFFEKFKLQSHVFTFTATYGVTNDLDVNILVPVLYTELDIGARAVLNNQSGVHTFTPTGAEISPTERRASAKDEKLGIGDVQLRAKYRFLESDGLNIGGGLGLRIETGSEDDFQGIGDTTVTPFLAVSQDVGMFNLHGSGGFEVHTDNTDRTRARYGVGATAELMKSVALTVDIIGSSNLQSEEISVDVPQFRNAPGTSTVLAGTTTFSQDVSTDIIDVAPGIKVALSDRVVAFVQFFVPINDDGLRTDFTPAGGIQATF